MTTTTDKIVGLVKERLGRMGGYKKGPGGYCVCPKCGAKIKHSVGTPCYKQKCPECGEKMTREL